MCNFLYYLSLAMSIPFIIQDDMNYYIDGFNHGIENGTYDPPNYLLNYPYKYSSLYDLYTNGYLDGSKKYLNIPKFNINEEIDYLNSPNLNQIGLTKSLTSIIACLLNRIDKIEEKVGIYTETKLDFNKLKNNHKKLISVKNQPLILLNNLYANGYIRPLPLFNS